MTKKQEWQHVHVTEYNTTRYFIPYVLIGEVGNIKQRKAANRPLEVVRKLYLKSDANTERRGVK